MLDKSKLVAFISTSEPDKSLSFYKQSLGLVELENTPFALVFDANGTTIRIQKVESVVDVPYTVLGWAVTNIVATVQQLVENGVRFTHFDNLSQDDLGIWQSPGGAKVAWFKDPDGNLLSITEGA